MFTLSRRIGIDLGTSNTIVWVQGKGIALNEPTVVAVSLQDQRVVAVGNQARNMLGRTPDNMLASRPIQHGVIADYIVTEALLRACLREVVGKAYFLKPEVMVSVPAGSTQVERRAVFDAIMAAGARTAFLIDKPLAAIIGAGVPIAEASGSMVVDIGGGAAESAVVSLGGVVVNRSIRIGGGSFDEAIVKYVRKQHGVTIGEQTAEQIKIEIGSALPLRQQASKEVKGRDTAQGLPRQITLTSSEVYQAMEKPLHQMLEMIKKVLEDVPPELASDIIDKGVILTGGGALLRGLDRCIAESMQIPVTIAEKPQEAVARGMGVVLDHFEMYQHAVQRKS